MSPEFVRENFEVCAKTGQIYRRRGERLSPVGYRNGRGYIEVHLGKRRLSGHRIVWTHVHGQIPEGMEIDHINHVKTDNRIENLRLVSRRENMRNRPLPSQSRTGYMGVHYAQGKFVGTVNTEVVGRFDTAEEAAAAVRKRRDELGFAPGHGSGRRTARHVAFCLMPSFNGSLLDYFASLEC